MSDLFIFDKTYSVLGKALDISEKRNSLITSNIANMDTIGYKLCGSGFQRDFETSNGEGVGVPIQNPPEAFQK